jgi:F1F0 ATPase subunit 2
VSALTNILIPAIAGLVLGTMYFGGLWLTLRHLARSHQPAFLAFGSYFGRLAACFTGFYLISRVAGLPGLLVCLAAFIIVRMVLVRRWGKPELNFQGIDDD